MLRDIAIAAPATFDAIVEQVRPHIKAPAPRKQPVAS
jgi:hypothetical protein